MIREATSYLGTDTGAQAVLGSQRVEACKGFDRRLAFVAAAIRDGSRSAAVARCPCMLFLIQQARVATNAREMKGSGSQRGVLVVLGRSLRLCFERVPDTCALTSLTRGRQIQNDAGSGPGEARRTAELERLKGCVARVYENNN